MKDLLLILPISVGLGWLLAFFQGENWLPGFLGFSLLLLLGLLSLVISVRWASAGKTLAWIVVLAFALRLAGGVATYMLLPIYGYEDEDDRAGFVFTDAHRRDDQAWELASSGRPLIVAFTDRFAYDQYGGLLAFSAFIYRYLSPDAHRPLMLVLLSGLIAALGIPFLWRAANQAFGEKIAWASVWVFALYPDSILLGGSAMREPYLMTFSAFAFWGFVKWFDRGRQSSEREPKPRAWLWLAFGLLGMLLVSPVVALVTLIIFVGWIFFTRESGAISWKTVLVLGIVFIGGLFFLSSSLNRSGEFDATSPLHVINDWLRLAVRWDAYQLERESGWVQKIFDESPDWIRLPFVTIYGVFQDVLPAALIVPTTFLWKVIYIARSLGWYLLLPLLILSFIAAAGETSNRTRNLWMWLTLIVWAWILLAALRAGGDKWDNPRYRTILFLWQALVAGYVWVWWRETRNPWFIRVIACELVFLLVFTQWYGNRYLYWPGQLPFATMVLLIIGLWGIILSVGWWHDAKRARQQSI
jgi:hypothetical protein